MALTSMFVMQRTERSCFKRRGRGGSPCQRSYTRAQSLTPEAGRTAVASPCAKSLTCSCCGGPLLLPLSAMREREKGGLWGPPLATPRALRSGGRGLGALGRGRPVMRRGPSVAWPSQWGCGVPDSAPPTPAAPPTLAQAVWPTLCPTACSRALPRGSAHCSAMSGGPSADHMCRWVSVLCASGQDPGQAQALGGGIAVPPA